MKRAFLAALIAAVVDAQLAGSLLAQSQTAQPAAVGEDAASAPGKVEISFGETYAQRGDTQLKADMYVPAGEGPFPAVLVVHGGAWRSGTRAQLGGLAEKLAEGGYTAAAISYRLAPQDKFPAQLEDCQAALRWMRTEAARWKIDPARIAGLGYSAGGHLVTLLGALNGATIDGDAATDQIDDALRLQAVVAGGAPCEFQTMPADSRGLAFWLGGTRGEKPDLYRLASPTAFATGDDPPMFFYHGEGDRLVSVESPQAMCDKLAAAGATGQLHVVPRVGHGGAAADRRSLELGFAFLQEHLGQSGDSPSDDDARAATTAAGAAP